MNRNRTPFRRVAAASILAALAAAGPAAAQAPQDRYGFPPPATGTPDPDFRLPPQGPQFIGR